MTAKSHSELRDWYLSYLGTCQRYEFQKLGTYVQPNFILQGKQIGLDGFIDNLNSAVKGWPKLRWEPRKIAIDIEQGPMICVWFDMYYERDSKEVHFQEIAFYRMRDGKMAESEVMFWGPKPEGGPEQSSSSFDRARD